MIHDDILKRMVLALDIDPAKLTQPWRRCPSPFPSRVSNLRQGVGRWPGLRGVRKVVGGKSTAVRGRLIARTAASVQPSGEARGAQSFATSRAISSRRIRTTSRGFAGAA
jgi:hypothetical protein